MKFLNLKGFSRNEISGGNDFVAVYDLPQNTSEPAHLSAIDTSTLISRNPDIVHIDAAHRQGLIHHGAWILLIDSNQKLLMLKRGPQLITCPNSWSPMGEHRLRYESIIDTVKRGMNEELGPIVWRRYVKRAGNLTSLPLYYIRDYGEANENRVDRQVTWIYHVQLKSPGETVGNVMNLDSEVADWGWFGVNEIEEWLQRTPDDFCHETIVQMLKISLDSLGESLKRHDQVNIRAEIE
eukprot:CAMPEP_0171313268 /NCGR_PEP_ID=MMETSP0816-20121228/40039_1 /TAXON_ID=420281 /ORGANISM="Proboscia inermis, Strain CCAP1064/1" /LENGTH=237 /DNA_ID=CAMNT_0011800381 /DNA_START=26 /DNA_END=739 /DNA_ORIENTATION=+